MKTVILLFFLSFITLLNAQSSEADIETYNFKYSYVSAKKSENELFTKPWGRNITINYDEFLKSIEIIYFDTSNKESALKLSYLSEAPSGYWLMKDNFDKKYYVFNKLRINKFMLVLAEKIQGATFRIEMTNSLRETN